MRGTSIGVKKIGISTKITMVLMDHSFAPIFSINLQILNHHITGISYL